MWKKVSLAQKPTGCVRKLVGFYKGQYNRPVQMNNRPGSLFPDRDFPRAPFVHAHSAKPRQVGELKRGPKSRSVSND